MSFRPRFDCLWCGTPHATAGPDDIEGWAQLCPACIGRAGDNGFLRSRLRTALDERGRARVGATPTASAPGQPVIAPELTDAMGPGVAHGGLDTEMVAYYEARAPEYDDWYLRRGRYRHGPIDDMAWAAELDRATLWLDALPWQGEIVELRYFGGLSIEETGEVLSISPSTVKREWAVARAWLRRELAGSGALGAG